VAIGRGAGPAAELANCAIPEGAEEIADPADKAVSDGAKWNAIVAATITNAAARLAFAIQERVSVPEYSDFD